jgi:hypothetical protein
VYLLGGQKGPACSPASAVAYHLDTETGVFCAMPPLPESTYAGTAVVYDGRLHFISGVRADRATPSTDHWSIGLGPDGGDDGTWREEPPLPSGGGSHALAFVLTPATTNRAAIYAWGHVIQEYLPRNASAGDYSCVPTPESVSAAVWSFSTADGWLRRRCAGFPASLPAAAPVLAARAPLTPLRAAPRRDMPMPLAHPPLAPPRGARS